MLVPQSIIILSQLKFGLLVFLLPAVVLTQDEYLFVAAKAVVLWLLITCHWSECYSMCLQFSCCQLWHSCC